MQLILKVLLLIVIALVSLFFGGIIFYIVVIENNNFELSMLISIGTSVLGFLSFWFHYKTLQHYKLDALDKVVPQPSKAFWTLNVGFAGALILISGWIFYFAFLRFGAAASLNTSEDFILILILGVPFFIGVFILLESYYLKNLLKKNKERRLILEIDNIKGSDSD